MATLGVQLAVDIMPNVSNTNTKKYLYSYGKGRISDDDVIAGLQKIVKGSPLHKYLINIQLFIHIKDPVVEEIFEKDEIPIMFIPYNYYGITPQFYCVLVIKLGLHNQFVQMISATKANSFFQELLSTVVNKLFMESNQDLYEQSEESYLGVHLDTWRLYLISIAKYAKDEDTKVNEFYTNLLQSLLKVYVSSSFTKQEKLSIILRIAGSVCMSKSDYEDNSEISELNRDWAYDPYAQLAKKSRDTFEALFPELKNQSKTSSPNTVLKLVVDILTQNKDFEVNDDDKSKWSLICRTERLTWLDYIGACAYLTLIILKKHKEEIGEEANKLLSVISNLVAFKPKMSQEDFQGNIENFDQFCELISVYGQRERYQRKWFQEFLAYPEALIANKGILLASKFISISADYDIALCLVQKAFDLGCSRLQERIKSMVIGMLSTNPNVKSQKQEFVKEVFKNGIHGSFAKEEFVMELNMLCTKIGTIENESDTKMQSYWEDIVYSICFQHPIVAAEGILKQSIRTNQFKALSIAKPFFAFETEELLTNNLSNLPVFQTCLYNIINITEDYDPLFDHIVEATPSLISNGFIDFLTTHTFLTQISNDIIVKRKIEKLFKIVLIYEQLLEYGLKNNAMLEETSRHCSNFLDSLRVFTYTQSGSVNLSVMMKIRDKVYQIKDVMIKNQKPPTNPQMELTPEVEEEFKVYSLTELGVLYIRDESYRKAIKQFIQDLDNFAPVSFAMLLKHLVTLVFNTSNAEWNSVVEYFIQIVLQCRPELNQLSPLYVVNEAVYFAFSESMKNPTLFQRFLEFYNYFVEKLQASPELMGLLEQKSTIECLAGLTVAMHEIAKAKKDYKIFDSNIVRNILLMMLSLIDWMVVHNPDFDQIKKDLLIMVSAMRIPHGGGCCIPIHRSIISRIVKLKEAPLIALSDPVNDQQVTQQLFKNCVSMKLNQVPEEMSHLEKAWDARDTFPYCGK